MVTCTSFSWGCPTAFPSAPFYATWKWEIPRNSMQSFLLWICAFLSRNRVQSFHQILKSIKPKTLTNSIVQIRYSPFPRNAHFSDLIFCSFSLFFLLHSISARWNPTRSSVLRGPLNCHFLHGAFSNVISSSFKCPNRFVCTSFGDNYYISLLLLFFMCLLFPLPDY